MMKAKLKVIIPVSTLSSIMSGDTVVFIIKLIVLRFYVVSFRLLLSIYASHVVIYMYHYIKLRITFSSYLT